MTILQAVLLALTLRTTTYGYGEPYCGTNSNPKKCEYGAVTSSGEIFDPKKLTAAIPVPKGLNFTPFYISVMGANGKCFKIRINDKTSTKWVGNRGLDVTPAVVEKLTGKPAVKTWSGYITSCL